MADSALKSVTELLTSQKKKEGSSIQPKDFFWDQFLKYIASAILALTVLNISVEFLRGGGVSCFPPSDNVAIFDGDLEGKMLYEFAVGQTSYINNYCARSVPKTEYFPIYILIHGLLLIAPHYVWNALHAGDFDSFFSIADKLDRLRDNSGEYDSKNFDRVTKLEREYCGRRIFFSYILKLISQLFVCVGSLVFSAVYFVDCDFLFSFCCPDDNGCLSADDLSCPMNITGKIPKGWPLFINVPCVYTSLRILNLVRYADFFLLVVAMLLVLFGLVWCCVRHTEQLGHEAIARFSFHSCLNADFHSFPSPMFWPVCKCLRQKKEDSGDQRRERIQKLIRFCWIFTHYPQPHLGNLFYPRILNDLDFLLLMLFRADSSHGQVFKDIQISKDLKVFIQRDHQLLHLYLNVKQDVTQDENNEAIRRSQVPQPSDEGASGESRENGTGSNGKLPSSDSTEQENAETLSDKEFHEVFLKPGITNPERTIQKLFSTYLGSMNYDEELFSGMRDWIYYFARTFGPKRKPHVKESLLRNGIAVDISFGSVGFARVLARPFKKVVSMDFHPFYCDLERVVELKHFYTNYKTVRFPHDIFAQDRTLINKVSDELKEAIGKKEYVIDFIVVGPLTEEPKRVVVTLLLNLLSTAQWIGEKAVLLAIRPLKAGSKKLTDHFYHYEPPKQFFRPKTHSMMCELFDDDERKSCVRQVDDSTGVKVDLGPLPCVFEFTVYEYQKKISSTTEASILVPSNDTE